MTILFLTQNEVIQFLLFSDPFILYLLYSLIIKHMSDDNQKTFENQQITSYFKEPSLVKSDLHQRYKQLNEITSISASEAQQKFNRKNISYNSHDPYEIFHFQVEKLFHSFPFYIIHVKLSHFSLQAKIFRCQNCSPPLIYYRKNQIGNVFFADYERTKICIKSFSFKNQHDFQRIFSVVIKQWSIFKICSALQCAPLMENYFGFDIIIFDDCIQFACEKGQKITQLTFIQQQQLKEELSLMHSLKIIHFDVKPQNLVYSRHFQKPVFIDFGFSEIVREQCGYKTLTVFKGTPNFSSSQVLAIMNESQNYVDLYYNDAFGLNLVIKYLKIITASQFYDEYQCEYQLYKKIEEDTNTKCQEYAYLLKFQYHYLSGDEVKSKQYLHSLLKLDHNFAKQILSFMKKVVKEKFISSILMQDLKQYSSLVNYKQISQSLKIKREQFFLRPQCYQQSQFDENSDASKIQPISYNGTFIFVPNFKHYTKIIMELAQLEEETVHNFLAIALESIRFDIRNNEFPSKVKIAHKIIPMLNFFMEKNRTTQKDEQIQQISKQIQEKEGLKVIKSFIILLLKFCFGDTCQKWVKNRIFDLFQQAILLDIDISKLIDPLLAYVNIHYQRANQIIQTVLQCTRLISLMDTIKTEHISFSHDICKKINSFRQIQTNKFRQETQDSNNISTQSICKIMDILYQPDKQIQASLLKNTDEYLSHIKNFKVRRYLHYHLMQKRIQHAFTSINSQSMLKIIEQIKHSELRKLDFLMYVGLNIKLINHNCRNADIISYCDYIKKVINCDFIYDRLNLANRVTPLNVSLFNSRIDYAIIKDSYQKNNCHFIHQLSSIIGKIENKQIMIDATLHQKLFILYKIYQQSILQRKTQHQRNIKYFFKLFHVIKIEFFFYCLSEQTKGVFISNLTQSKGQLQKYKNEILSGNSQFAVFYFRFIYYQCKLFLFEKRYKQCISHLHQLANLFDNIGMVFLALQMLIDLYTASLCSQDEEQTLTACLLLYNFCKKKNLYPFYLQERSVFLSHISMVAFYEQREDILHELLIKLVNLVSQHPLESYVSSFFKLCERFLKAHSEYINIFHFSRFQGNSQTNLQNNPYLLIFYSYSLKKECPDVRLKLYKIIASNCNRLSKYGKKKILQQYFCIFLMNNEIKERNKKRFIFRYAKCYIHLSQFKKNYAKNIFKIKKKGNCKQIKKLVSKKNKLIQYL